MTSASDRADDPIVVSSGGEDDEAPRAQVIHASIVHDDEAGGPGPDDQTAGADRPASGDQTASSGLPHRAWIPDRPMPGSGRPGQPAAAQAVPAPRAPAEPGEDMLDARDLSDEDVLGQNVPPEPEPASGNPWPEIQSMFVDDPRQAVEQAASVTSTALGDLITAARQVEQTLSNDWKPDRTGTEELRVALRGYRDLAARIATLTRDFQRR